jgi:hypothetical protein
MDEKRKVVLLTVLIFCGLGLIAAGYFLFLAPGSRPAPAPKPAETAAAPPASTPAENIPVFPETPLNDSDGLIRRLARELSSDASLDSWLESKDLVRKFTAAIVNIAAGESPAKHITFFSPAGPFRVYRAGSSEYIDPKSYDRYDVPTQVFVSFAPAESVRFYKGLRPLFQEAYRDLGYPGRDFDAVLKKAVLELLRTPVVEGDVRVEKKVKTYAFADPRLEDLSDAQKEFLRMGPANVETIQVKLRQMAEALGIPSDQIPRPRIYSAK